jgi:hypothetical protein
LWGCSAAISPQRGILQVSKRRIKYICPFKIMRDIVLFFHRM